MDAIIVGLIGAIISVTGVFSYGQYSQNSDTFGALPLIQSAQLAASPTNGLVLKTDGTSNYWGTDDGGAGSGLSSYDAFTHPISGVSATTSALRITGGLNASSTVLFDNATTTSFAITNLTAASCDVKASTAGVLSCGTDATGGASAYDAWTHPAADESATSSQLTTSGGAGAGHFFTINATGGALADAAIRYYLNSTIANWVAGVDDNGDDFGFAYTTGGTVDLETNRLVTIRNTGNLGIGTTSPYAKLAVVGEVVAQNFTATSSSATSTFTKLVSTGTASTSALIVSGLNAASCDVKASTSGVLSCGTDATGAGGAAFGQVFELVNANTIAATTTNKNLVVGSASLPASEACTLCVFATNTGTNYLIFASTTAGYGGDLLSFVDSAGNSLLYVNSAGALTSAAAGEFGGALSVLGSTITFGSTGVSLTHDSDGALTLSSLGDTNNEALTVNLDDTADSAVWSSSTGVTKIDWGAFNLTTTGKIGVASSTPTHSISVGTTGSSYGSVAVTENPLATSTTMTINWANGNQQLVRLGGSATTIGFSNASTSGMTLKLVVCNPNATAGAITWNPQILWSGGVAPSQTTTANKCDVWSFIVTQATGTAATSQRIFGAQTQNF